MNRICALLKIQHPIIQAGMVWCSGWELASAVSNAGGLGVIGAGSMYPEILEEHLRKMRNHCNRPFGVNLPLLYPQIEEHISKIIDFKVPIVITSAGNPKIWTKKLQENGIKVGHVVSSAKFAQKAQEAGVDFIIAEGFEAGGHNGREETTTFCLLPEVRHVVSLPLVAAGGIKDGRSMLAAMVLGADAVQLGTRFVASQESSAHHNFKDKVVETKEGDTALTLKEITPVRLIKNAFYDQIQKTYSAHGTKKDLLDLLGKGRAKKGMFEGDLVDGELEIGQVASSIHQILPAKTIIENIMSEFLQLKSSIQSLEP